MAFTDYYALLQVPPDATPEQLRAAYLEQVKKWHPDHNGGSAESTERTTRLNRAWAVLGDPAKRREYDRYYQARKNAAAGADPRAAGPEVPGAGGILELLMLLINSPVTVSVENEDGDLEDMQFTPLQIMVNLENSIARLAEAIDGKDGLSDQMSELTDITEEAMKLQGYKRKEKKTRKKKG